MRIGKLGTERKELQKAKLEVVKGRQHDVTTKSTNQKQSATQWQNPSFGFDKILFID